MTQDNQLIEESNTKNSNSVSETDLLDLMNSLDITSDMMSEISMQLSNSCTSALDDYVRYISESLRQPQTVSNDLLDEFILNLPVYIYYASSAVESLGIKEDVSLIAKKRKVWETVEHLIKNKIGGSTVASRTAAAESICTKDVLVNDIYSAAYKSAKAKVTYAYEILASCKKVLSRRIEELKAFNSDTNRNNPRFESNQS